MAQQTRVNVVAFTPDQAGLQMLKEMGFSENDAIIALEITNNEVEHAVTFLMNNPEPSVTMGARVTTINRGGGAGPISMGNHESRPMTGMSSVSEQSDTSSVGYA